MVDINKCLDDALNAYLEELRQIDDMLETGEVEYDEIRTMQRMAYKFYDENVERCYQEFEGRSTPGRSKK